MHEKVRRAVVSTRRERLTSSRRSASREVGGPVTPPPTRTSQGLTMCFAWVTIGIRLLDVRPVRRRASLVGRSRCVAEHPEESSASALELPGAPHSPVASAPPGRFEGDADATELRGFGPHVLSREKRFSPGSWSVASREAASFFRCVADGMAACSLEPRCDAPRRAGSRRADERLPHKARATRSRTVDHMGAARRRARHADAILPRSQQHVLQAPQLRRIGVALTPEGVAPMRRGCGAPPPAPERRQKLSSDCFATQCDRPTRDARRREARTSKDQILIVTHAKHFVGP